jgi:hypothetical protein
MAGGALMPSSKPMLQHRLCDPSGILKFIDDPSCNDFEVHHLRAPPILRWPEEWRDEDICRVLDMIPDDKLESFWYVLALRLMPLTAMSFAT